MAVVWTAFLSDSNAELIHDADHYVLKAQHGEQWAADDKAVDAKLAEFKKRNGGKSPDELRDRSPAGRPGIIRPALASGADPFHAELADLLTLSGLYLILFRFNPLVPKNLSLDLTRMPSDLCQVLCSSPPFLLA